MAEPPGPCGAGRFCYAYAACWADRLLCGVAAPRVLRASRVLSGGPGCLVCRWAAVFLRCLLPRQISGRGAACPLARRPRRELRSARRLEARPGPAAAHGYRSRALSIAQDSHPVVTSHIPEPTPNFACNSPTTLSNHEFTTLELQRFQALLKLHPIELHASFLRGGRIGARWWCSGIPLARCAVVWNRRRLCSLVSVWG